MKNTGLSRFQNANVNNFTSETGIIIRRKINFLWRKILKCGTKRKITVERYPKLHKKEPYIFVANHSFDEDIISILASIDRNAYMLQGTTDQMLHNPVFLALWANGMIYVNRMDSESRKQAVEKMKRILTSGSSVMIFPEGGYNNTDNQLLAPFFSSPYYLCKELGRKVVPVIAYNPLDSNQIYIYGGNPMDLSVYEKQEALSVLRDEMSTILWNCLEKHTGISSRSEIPEDAKKWWMEKRKEVYECQKWHGDVWNEELTYYPGHGVVMPKQAREYIDKVKITEKNAGILADTIVRREEDRKYDFKEFMRRNMKYL